MLPSVLSAERTEDTAIEEDSKKGIIRPRKGIQQGLNAAGIPIGPPPAGRRVPRGGRVQARRRRLLHMPATGPIVLLCSAGVIVWLRLAQLRATLGVSAV